MSHGVLGRLFPAVVGFAEYFIQSLNERLMHKLGIRLLLDQLVPGWRPSAFGIVSVLYNRPWLYNYSLRSILVQYRVLDTKSFRKSATDLLYVSIFTFNALHDCDILETLHQHFAHLGTLQIKDFELVLLTGTSQLSWSSGSWTVIDGTGTSRTILLRLRISRLYHLKYVV